MAFGILIALVGIATLVWWFFFRGKKDDGPKKSEGPSIALGVEKVRLHPANKKVEEYMVYEYNTGTTTASAKNIDITLKWTNGAGFNGITGLRFYRTSNGKTYHQDVTADANLKDYASGTITFSGSDIPTGTVGSVKWTDPSDFIGNNVFTVAYEKDGNWTVFSDVSSTTEITQGMLDRTLDLSSVSDVTIEPLQNTSGFVASRTIGPRTYYSVYDYYGNVISGLSGIRFDYDGTNQSMSFKNSTFEDIEIIDGITDYRFEKYTDNTYLISFTNTSNQVEYLFKKSDGTIGTHTKTTAFSGTEELLNASRFQIIQNDGTETVTIRTTTTPASTTPASEDLKPGKYNIKSKRSSKYCQDLGVSGPVGCTTDNRGAWETFTVNKLGDGTYSLLGGNDNKYCGDFGADGLKCVAPSVGLYEKLTIEPVGTTPSEFTIKALEGPQDGKGYCQNTGDDVKCLKEFVNRAEWETFTFEPVTTSP